MTIPNDSDIVTLEPYNRALIARYDLIPSGPLLAVAEAFGIGATKYGDVPITEKPASYFIGALRRHLDAWEAGESHARDDGQHHLAAVAVRALQLMLVEGDPDLDDRESCAP